MRLLVVTRTVSSIRLPLATHGRSIDLRVETSSTDNSRLRGARPRDDVGSDCAHSHRLPSECGAGTTSPSELIPFRNLKRSLPVERTRVVFSAMMDL